MLENFKFKGISSEQYAVLMAEKWINASPPIVFEEIQVNGRDGSIFDELSYGNVRTDVLCTLLKPEYHAEVSAWLKGTGEFEINGKKTIARIYDSVTFQKQTPFTEVFTIPMILDPFWHSAIGDTFNLDAKGKQECEISNLGNVPSVPIITLKGTGSASITVSGLTFGVQFPSTGLIEIDCLEKTENNPLCVSIGFEYPTLSPGLNKIKWTGDVEEICISRKSRWML